MSLARDLGSAVYDGGLTMVFTPIVCIDSLGIFTFEAVPWYKHPAHGSVRLTDLNPFTQDLGLSESIANWSLEASCAAIAQCVSSGYEPPTLSVALPFFFLAQKETVAIIERLLAKSNVEPGRLRIQVHSEEYIDAPTTALDALVQLRSMGVRVMLDGIEGLRDGFQCLQYFSPEIVRTDPSDAWRVRLRGFDRDHFAKLRDFCQALGSDVATDGVQTFRDCALLLELGYREITGGFIGAGVSLRAMMQHYLSPDEMKKSG